MDARLREGITLFNQGKFFDSHEVWENFYRDTDQENKAFLEGLIGLAAAYRLFCDFGEIRGSARLIYQALIRLENYQPAFLQVQVKDLCQSAEAWAKAAEAAGAKPSASDIPKIKLQRFRFFS
jgi:predicted metal-dependent hydrolase